MRDHRAEHLADLRDVFPCLWIHDVRDDIKHLGSPRRSSTYGVSLSLKGIHNSWIEVAIVKHVADTGDSLFFATFRKSRLVILSDPASIEHQIRTVRARLISRAMKRIPKGIFFKSVKKAVRNNSVAARSFCKSIQHSAVSEGRADYLTMNVCFSALRICDSLIMSDVSRFMTLHSGP